jgi:hypothetical protein
MEKGPKRTTRLFCENCNYSTCQNRLYQRHILSAKHIFRTFRTEKGRLGPPRSMLFSCDTCNYSTRKNSQFQRHILTAKHIRLSNTGETPPTDQNSFQCKCGKSYTARNSLWYHKLKCFARDTRLTHAGDADHTNHTDHTDNLRIDSLTKTIIALVKQNSILQQTQLEMQTTINQMLPTLGNTTNNNHTNCNNTFNVQMFLDNHCQNAISIQEFVNSIELTMDHMVAISNDGYVDSISNVLIEALNKLELTDRPLHCTDLKRETIYIKDEEQWNKSSSDAPLMNRVITKIEDKHYSLVGEYVRSHPQTRVLDTPEYNLYTKACMNSLGNGEEHHKLNKKIYKKLFPAVKLDKDHTSG